MTEYQGGITIPDPSYRGQYLVINYLLSLSTPICDITDDNNFVSIIKNKVQVSAIQSGNVKSKQGKVLDALALSKKLDDLTQPVQ